MELSIKVTNEIYFELILLNVPLIIQMYSLSFLFDFNRLSTVINETSVDERHHSLSIKEIPLSFSSVAIKQITHCRP